MKPTFYIVVTNKSTGVSSFVKDFYAGILVTQPDNYNIRVMQKEEAERRLIKLQKYYEKVTHLEFQLKPVRYKQPLDTRKSTRLPRKPDKPRILQGKKRRAINEQIEQRKEQYRKYQLKADAQRQAAMETKPVNLSAPSILSSKVDCRHCGVCRDCLTRLGLL